MIFKVFLCIIGIIVISLFVVPLISVTLNVGNIFGILYGLTLFINGIFFDSIFAKIVLACMVIFLIPFSITIAKIAMATRQKDTNRNTVIILGCRVKGDRPTLALIERCRAGAEYLKQDKNAIAILSGGQGSDELISEAECMCKIMQDFGIDKSRLYIENKSTSTKENLLFSKAIIEQNGLDEHITIVSSEYHLYRANMIAKDCGYDNISLIPSKSKWYCVPTFFTREVFGIWAKKLKIKE